MREKTGRGLFESWPAYRRSSIKRGSSDTFWTSVSSSSWWRLPTSVDPPTSTCSSTSSRSPSTPQVPTSQSTWQKKPPSSATSPSAKSNRPSARSNRPSAVVIYPESRVSPWTWLSGAGRTQRHLLPTLTFADVANDETRDLCVNGWLKWTQ